MQAWSAPKPAPLARNETRLFGASLRRLRHGSRKTCHASFPVWSSGLSVTRQRPSDTVTEYPRITTLTTHTRKIWPGPESAFRWLPWQGPSGGTLPAQCGSGSATPLGGGVTRGMARRFPSRPVCFFKLAWPWDPPDPSHRIPGPGRGARRWSAAPSAPANPGIRRPATASGRRSS